ncbi:HAMP domain-containing sensor histidine kinase [uncultured Pseudodesulfovibrio sp.]|uniref:sensor histidine kinase n=1 Tax=uncultured Pseudodesulfovibrio sp. TaxID=2035858 RepID=UPI0029C91D35|nr:HAMP domain-containing sensor histidine kinase [uncultured Pseudodesulfovibrio sp.]
MVLINTQENVTVDNNRLSTNVQYSRSLIGILVLAFITAIALPLINVNIIYPAYSKVLVSSIMEETGRLAEYVIPPTAKHSELTHKVLEDSGFAAAIYRMENDLGLLKIKVYSPTGLILYSTDFNEIGTHSADTQSLDNVIKEIPCGEIKQEQGMDILETCVPIMRDGTFLGVFQLVSDLSPHMQKLSRINALATYGTILACCSILVVGGILLRFEANRIRDRKQSEILKADVEQITRHDIKSPLIGALNGIEYLRKYTDINEDQKSMLNDMRTSVSTGLDLINRSLDIYKMETGEYQYEPQAVDILAIGQRVTGDLSGLATMNNVTTAITRSGQPLATEDSLVIMAEESLCYSLLANLIKNGIEASAPDQCVCIDFTESTHASIAIHNPAVVPDAIRDTFFEKYATADKATGTGLGTYSAKLMTEAMGGTISLETSVEKGTTITVTLPLLTVPE